MLKNIGKLIHFVAIALAVVFFAAFLGFGVACLLAATAEGVDEALKAAGFQGAVLSFVLALVAPLFCVVAYGFGSLIIATERNAQDVREMKEKLHAALTEGLLSDEIARKNGQVFAKLIAQMPTAAPAPTAAPVQRFVEEVPEEPQAPAAPAVEEASAPVAEAPTEEAPIAKAPVAAPLTEEPAQAPQAAPVPPKPPVRTAAPRTIRVARPGATPLRPVNGDEETF